MSKRRVIPGFGLSMGFTITYLSLILLIPLLALLIKAAGVSGAEWRAILCSPRVIAATQLTFGLSALAAAVNVVIGMLVTWVLVRYQFPGKKLLDSMVDLPFALPTAVAGITLTTIYGQSGWIGSRLAASARWAQDVWHPTGVVGEILGTWVRFGAAYSQLGIFIALTFIGFPFVVRTLQPVMEDMGHEVEEAAATLGAGRWTVFWRVILPMLVPALITGFTLAFARAIGEYGSVMFIAASQPMKTETLPLLIVFKLEQFKFGDAAVLAASMLTISFLLLFIINLLQRRLDWHHR